MNSYKSHDNKEKRFLENSKTKLNLLLVLIFFGVWQVSHGQISSGAAGVIFSAGANETMHVTSEEFGMNGYMQFLVDPQGSSSEQINFGFKDANNNFLERLRITNSEVAVTGALNATTYLLNGQPFNSSPWTSVDGSIHFSGNVGIGTSSPAAPLDVSGIFKADIVIAGDLQNGIEAGHDGTDAYFLKFGAGNLNFSAAQNEATQMTLTPEGNLGIGTVSPDKGKLHVKGSFHVENDNDEQLLHVSKSKNLVFVGKEAWTHYNNAVQANQPLVDEGSYAMWVSEGIVTEDIALIDVNEWSDHVFEEDYKLASLDEVETYIREHGHLPNIPSQSEVSESGYTIQSVNAKFLEKIEELTLYTIAQEKQIKTMQLDHAKQLEAIMARLESLEQKLNNQK